MKLSTLEWLGHLESKFVSEYHKQKVANRKTRCQGGGGGGKGRIHINKKNEKECTASTLLSKSAPLIPESSLHPQVPYST